MRTSLLSLLLLTGCGTLSTARPLERGQHEVGATVGGGVLDFGGAPLPLPNVVVEGRSGVASLADRPLDLNYGLNLTALPFGILQTHLGAGWLVAKPDGAIPALSWTNRFWMAANLFGAPTREVPRVDAWGAWQTQVDVSWDVGPHLVGFGLAQYTEFQEPVLTLTPRVGATFDTDPKRPDGVRLHVDAHWFGANQRRIARPVQFVGGGQGLVGVTLGVSYLFDRSARAARLDATAPEAP